MIEGAIFSKRQELQPSILSYLVFFPGLLNNMTWSLMNELRITTMNVLKEQEISMTSILRSAELTQGGKIIAYFHFIGMEN